VADRDQTARPSDDPLRGLLRRHLPGHPPRAALVRLLARPVPEREGPALGQLQLAARLDIFAISTYGLVSLAFWYVGLLPDLATVRDRATHPWRKKLYNAMSFGWTGSHRMWRHYESAYMILAALATPLVFSVHTIVSFDFATSVMPGWHTTIFPPYFVIGAIFSGFAMVITLMTFMRGYFGMKNYITLNHMEAMAKILMFTGMMVGFAYSTEFFMAWYSGSEWEGFVFKNRAFGPYWWAYAIMFTCKRDRPAGLLVEEDAEAHLGPLRRVDPRERRDVVRAVRHRRDVAAPRLPPSSWGMYALTRWDYMILFGSFGLFFTLFLLFVRFLPVVAISEVKGVMDRRSPGAPPPTAAPPPRRPRRPEP